jgi:hypothetical protein
MFSGFITIVWAIETRPAFGPWLADSVRGLVGPEWVSRGEEAYYAVIDRVDRLRYANTAPANMWEHHSARTKKPLVQPHITAIHAVVNSAYAVPLAIVPAPAVVSPSIPQVTLPAPTALVEPTFRPTDFSPPIADVAAVGDGVWEAWEAGPAGTEPLLYRTQVHPDETRPEAVTAIVAMDLKRLELRTVPGINEPKSSVMPASQRSGLVPAQDRAALVAAFNGGWQAVHGHLGMKVGGVELLPPVSSGCGVAALEDGTVKIASWSVLKPDYETLRWIRQTPPCLVENGKEDAKLDDGKLRWGAALNGRTVVRRSAIGLNADGTILYYAIGDSMTSAAITRALEAAGAVSAAMLDINHAFPRFVTFVTNPALQSWQDHLPLTPSPPTGAYLTTAANKDFFYVRMR